MKIIHTNEIQVSKDLHDAKKTISVVNEFIQYCESNSIEMNVKSAEKLIQSRLDIESIEEFCKTQFLEVENKYTRTQAQNGLKMELLKAPKPPYMLNFNYVSYQDNKAVLMDNANDLIKETNSVILTDPKDIELHEKHTQITKEINELAKALGVEYNEVFELLFETNYGTKKIDPNYLGYVKAEQNRKKQR